MNKIALRVLFGLLLFSAAVYMLLYSNIPTSLEGANLDGSSSITWRSSVVLLLLAGLTQWISFWAFRRHIALQFLVGLGLCVATAVVLFEASFSFSWEPHNPDGTFPLTWRSDLIILALISVTQGISFSIFRLTKPARPRHLEGKPTAHPNI